MKILITGGQGQIGRDLGQVLQPGHEVISLSKAQLDISFPERIEGTLQACCPDYLVNVAAFTNVDVCETQRNLAWKVNGEGAGWLAKACRERRIPLLHLSTDYVFDGRKAPTEAYVEEDPTDPLSFYGQSKLEGEREVQGSGGEFLILRTAWVYGIGGVNFLKTILRRALQKQPLKIVNDQFGSPTWSHRIARQIRRLIEAEVYGLYHAAAEGYATWFEVAKTFFGLMEISADISPCSSAEYPTVARRPKNSRLENRRLKCEGLSEMKDWREDLTEFVGRFREELLREAKKP